MPIEIELELTSERVTEVFRWLLSSNNMNWETVAACDYKEEFFYGVEERPASYWKYFFSDDTRPFGPSFLSEEEPLSLRIRFYDEDLASWFKLTWC